MIKIRSSQVGNIMSEPKNKADKDAGLLSETAKTYIKQLYRELKYNRKKGLINKYIEKGLYNEETAITMLSELDKKMYFKNEKFFENDFITGTPDIITDIIIDIKCSFDIFTFPFPDDKINPMYYWQMQSYMALTGKQMAKLAYVLTDTPEFIIKREKTNLMYKLAVEQTSDEKLTEMYYRIEREMKFEDLELKDRICTFEIQRNDTDIERIYKQVEKCRNFYETLK